MTLAEHDRIRMRRRIEGGRMVSIVGELGPLPPAAIRTQVTVPLRFPDGYTTTPRVFSFDGLVDGREHLALGLGDWERAIDRATHGGRAPLVRPHSECLTGDVFGSQRCDCGPQLREAVEPITEAGGILLYLRQEGRRSEERRVGKERRSRWSLSYLKKKHVISIS